MTGFQLCSTQLGGRAAKKSSKGFTQLLRIHRKSPPSSERGSNNDRDESDSCSFGNVMSMMMMQNHFDNKKRGPQYQKESELRERGVQLRCEEMAIAREEACAQWQMMNVMLMTMLNKKGGYRTTATHHPAQAWDKL